MLQKLNERLQGFFAWVVIILIAITFTLVGVDYYFQSRHASDAEVTVNNEVISKSEFDSSYRRARQQRDPSQLTAASERQLKKTVLDNLVIHKIILQAALSVGFGVTPNQTAGAITSISNFQQDGLFSEERYHQVLSNALFTPETFRKEVSQGMVLKQQSFAFIGTSFALSNEIKRFVKLYMQTRNYNYLQIPAEPFIDKTEVKPEQIDAYYKAHKQEFMAAEQIKIQYIKLSMPEIKAKIKIDDKDIAKYYEENQTNFQLPARWQLAHILFAIPATAPVDLQNRIKQNADQTYAGLKKNPEQFNDLVKTLSADKLSADANGVLPWISADQPGFDKALLKLTKPDAISPPIKTAAGYEIYRLIDYKPSSLKPLEAVKQQITEQLIAEKSQAIYAQKLERLSDLSYQTPDSLQPVVDELKLQEEESPYFSREGGQDLVTKSKQVVNTAYSHDVLELKNNSEPVQLDNDTVVVLRVIKHLAAKEKSLAEVKQQIIDKLAAEQAQLKAKALGEQFLSSAPNAAENVKLIESNKLIWKDIENATRDTNKADAIINELAFSLPKVDTQDGRRLVNGDYVIVRLKKIVDGKYKNLDKEQQASIAQQIEASNGLMEYDLYVNRLVNSAKIDRDGSA